MDNALALAEFRKFVGGTDLYFSFFVGVSLGSSAAACSAGWAADSAVSSFSGRGCNDFNIAHFVVSLA